MNIYKRITKNLNFISIVILFTVLINAPLMAIGSCGNCKIERYRITPGSVSADTNIEVNYQLLGVIGQTETATTSEGGSYHLTGGFLANPNSDEVIFRNNFEQ